jgi:uncharacterized ion transporter superfamily protein YfcC
MKNKNLWLSLLIATGIIFLITWVVPSTNYDDAGALTLGTINPTGVWDIFYYMSMLLSWFGQNFVFIIIMGAFYGIVSKTGALRTLEERIASRFKKRERLFLIFSSSLFVLITSLTGINFPLLVFVPLVIGVILTLGYNKITALMATVASILVGTMGSLYANNLYAAIASYVEKGISYGWYKLALIVIGLLAINGYLYLTAKIGKGKDKEEINEEMLFIEKVEGPKKQKIWPIITAFSVILGLFILGMTPWESMFKFTGFTEFHTKLLELKIGSFAIIKSILGSSTAAFGTWDVSDAATVIAIVTVALIFLYRIKWEDAAKGALSGIVKLLPTALIVLLANIIFVIVSQSGALNTIVKALANLTEGINVFTYSFISFLGAALVNENYITSYVTGTLNTVLGNSTNLPLLVLIQQAMYGIAMLIVPTGAILLAGLAYLEVGYTKWVKNIWKFLLILAAATIIVLILAVVL